MIRGIITLAFLSVAAPVVATPRLPYLKPGCPLIMIDNERQLAMTPWVCAPQAGDQICKSELLPCDEVGKVDSIVSSSYGRDFNMHLLRIRPFYRQMESFSAYQLSPSGLYPPPYSAGREDDDPSSHEAATPGNWKEAKLLGLTVHQQAKVCTITGEQGVAMHSLDDVRTTNVLIDLIHEGEEDRSSIESSCAGFMTNFSYLPRLGFRCEGGEDDVYALVQGETLVGLAPLPLRNDSCREGFPEFLSMAGRFHVRDGLRHDYFDFRTRSYAGNTIGALDWPPLVAQQDAAYYTPVNRALLTLTDQPLTYQRGVDYSTSIVYSLRRSVDKDAQVGDKVESLRSTSAYLSQVFQAKLQRHEYHLLAPIHNACNEFHRYVLSHISDAKLAAGLLPECGHRLSALQAIILAMNHEGTLSTSTWIGQILSPPTAFAVIDTLSSNEPENFLKALEVDTMEELALFRNQVKGPSAVH